MEDRELQIRLAELQADLQIHLTTSFGVLAVLIALVIAHMQIFYSLPAEVGNLKTIFSVSLLVLVTLCIYTFLHFTNKVVVARKQIRDLRRQYIW